MSAYTFLRVITILYYNSYYYNRLPQDLHFSYVLGLIIHLRKSKIIIVREIPAFRCQDSVCAALKHVRLGKILPVSGPRSGAYAKPTASVSERKHIKDGALLKEERGKKRERERREQTALFPRELPELLAPRRYCACMHC